MATGTSSRSGGVPKEVTWGNLDKKKFFVVGAGMFSGVTCALYPLTVIKTRQMVDGSGRPPVGGIAIVRDIVKQRGVLGLYQGFGTIVVGTLPIRMVYLSTLEVVKARARGVCEALDLPPMAHGIADAAGGATASMCSQVLGVPIDIISQRQMVQGVSVKAADGGSTTLKGYRNGWHAVRDIVGKEGIGGLYRGFGASIVTLVPGSALWWGFYGTYQRIFWSALPDTALWRARDCVGGDGSVGRGGGAYGETVRGGRGEAGGGDGGVGSGAGVRPRSGGAATGGVRAEAGGVGGVGEGGGAFAEPSDGTVMGVQIASGICAGATSGFMTTPLDIVKTRLQVLSGAPGGRSHTFASTAAELYREHGASGFLRGVRPRMMSVAIWGTTMVTTYEFLKRSSRIDPDDV